MPVFDMLIRESIRLSQAYVAFRRNVGPEMYIDGKVIPTGALVAYPAADVHVDPAFYPDPWKFDPTRPQPQGNLTYLGWGGGVFLRLCLLTKGSVDTHVLDCHFVLLGMGQGERLASAHDLRDSISNSLSRYCSWILTLTP